MPHQKRSPPRAGDEIMAYDRSKHHLRLLAPNQVRETVVKAAPGYQNRSFGSTKTTSTNTTISP